jgi:hypothetical protein
VTKKKSESLGEKYEATVRDMITQQNQLTDQRMAWMTTCNGLLFAALGFTLGKPDAPFLTKIICFLGVSASFLSGIALVLASHAARRLLLWWQKNKPEGYDGPGVMNVRSPEREKFYYVYFAPWTLLSFLFTAGWVAILLFVL